MDYVLNFFADGFTLFFVFVISMSLVLLGLFLLAVIPVLIISTILKKSAAKKEKEQGNRTASKAGKVLLIIGACFIIWISSCITYYFMYARDLPMHIIALNAAWYSVSSAFAACLLSAIIVFIFQGIAKVIKNFLDKYIVFKDYEKDDGKRDAAMYILAVCFWFCFLAESFQLG